MEAYLPLAQNTNFSYNMVIRATADPQQIERVVRAAFTAADKTQPVYNVEPLEFYLRSTLAERTFTLALLTGMSVRTVSAKVVANLGWDKVKATHPVFAGDTLYAESTVLNKRESKSRPTQGIVTVSTRGVNQNGAEVMTFERTMLIYKRGHSPEDSANY